MNIEGYEQLVELYSSSVLTPFNLVQYLKIENYTSLEIKKNDKNDKLIAVIRFLINEKERQMYYEFDYNDRLLEVYSLGKNNDKEYVFNRKEKEKELLEQIKISRIEDNGYKKL